VIPPVIRKVISFVIRKFRSVSERQWKIAGITFLALMAAGPIWFLVYDLLGRKAWRDYEASERTRGVKLYLTDFIEPTVPDEDNFAALPIFQNTLNIQQRLPDFPRGKSGEIAAPEIGLQFEAEIWRTYFAKAGWIDTPSKDIAGDLRLALVRYDDALNELADGLRRPHCSFPIAWAPNPYQTPYPYRLVVAQAISVAGLRGQVSALGGDGSAALRDLRLIAGIRQRLATKEVHLPSSARSRLAQYETAIIYEGLSRHAWSAEQLRQIIELLKTSDPLKNLAYEFEIRRAMANGACEWVLTGNIPTANDRLSYHPVTWFDNAKVLRTFPGIVRRNQLVANRHYAMLRGRIDLDSGTFQGGNETRLKVKSNYYRIALSLTWGSDIRRCLTLAARSRLASTACALELYYGQHSAYPESLAHLVPRYLPAIPHEPTSKDSLIYYPTDDCRYCLYSRGMDGMDDGGKVDRKNFRYERDRALRDIPWTAPPPR